MPAPITPNKLRESIASLDGDFCEKFIASLQAPGMFSLWYKSVFTKDGELTDEYKAMVCLGTAGTEGDPASNPTEPPVVTGPGTTPPTQLPRLSPVYLTASQGLPSSIRLEWSESPGATHYVLVRSGSTVFNLPASQRSYIDNMPAGRAFFYRVTARNLTTGQTSVASNQALGYTGPVFPGLPPI